MTIELSPATNAWWGVTGRSPLPQGHCGVSLGGDVPDSPAPSVFEVVVIVAVEVLEGYNLGR